MSLILLLLCVLFLHLLPFSNSDFQRDVLADFYHQTQGDLWDRNDHWLSADVDVCDWYGIECSGKRVIAINLPSNGVGGNLPDSIGNLTSLERLTLSVNSVSGEVPKSLNSLRALYDLGLNDNSFYGQLPDLSHLLKLGSIDIARNGFEGEIPDYFNNFRNMWAFNINGNSFSGNLSGIWDCDFSVAGMGLLYLQNNRLSGEFNVKWCTKIDPQFCHAEGNDGLKCPKKGCCHMC